MAPVPEPEIDKMVELHGLGFCTREIGELTHWSKSAVRRCLLKRGVDLGPRGGNRRNTYKTSDIQRVVFLHDRMGYSQEDIAVILGHSVHWVKNRIERGGSSTRPRGGAGRQQVKRRLEAA